MKKQDIELSYQTLQIKEYKNKYRLTAEKIYQALGQNNYQNVFNCMTRFRANITTKSKVDIESIKKIDLVKGINWSGDQLQIIIGGEVVKVVDEFKRYEIELQNLVNETKVETKEVKIQEKKSIGSKILSFIAAVMVPSITILMAAGMFSALYSVLTIEKFGILKTSVETEYGVVAINMNNLNLFDIWSGIFFVLSKVLLSSVGLFFIYNTTSYLKGDVRIALAVGIILLSRAFFPVGGMPLESAKFGDWIYDGSQYAFDPDTGITSVIYTGTEKMGFLLFTIGTYPIVIGGYESAIIPLIVAGFVVTYLDKWIKTWMPTTIDIIFRPFLVIILTLFGLWFLLGPIAALLEYGLSSLVNLFSHIPYGFGTALIAFFWMPLALTGTHIAAIMPLITDMINNPDTGSMALAAVGCGPWGHVGSFIGVVLITRNANLRRLSLSAIPAGCFGVPEPGLYGVTLPKFWPFIMGCLGAAVGGLISGIMGVAGYKMAGMGFLAIIAAIDSLHPDLWWQTLLTWGISIGSAALFVVLTYRERKNELSYFKKGIHKLVKFTNLDKLTINQEFESELVSIKEMKDEYKKIDKYYSDISKYENKLINIETKETKNREKMYQKLTKLKEKLLKKGTQEMLDKFETLKNKYSTYNLDDEKAKVQTELNKIIVENKIALTKFNEKKETIYKNSLTSVEKNVLDETQRLIVENTMWDAINSVEIGYGIEDSKPVRFKKGN